MSASETGGLTPALEQSQRRGLVRRVAGLFRPYWRRVVLVCLAILVSAGLGVVNPLLTKVVFDRALFPSSGQPNLHLLYVLIAIMVAIAVVAGAIGVGQTYLTSVLGQGVMQDLRNRLYSHLQAMSLRFFTSTRTGEIQSRLQNSGSSSSTRATTRSSASAATGCRAGRSSAWRSRG